MKSWIKVIICICVAYLVTPPPVGSLLFFNPCSTNLIARRNINNLGTRVINPYKWQSLNNVSPTLVRAILASEDAKFYKHKGIDKKAIIESIKHALRKGKRPRGASTITQQLVKNLYLTEGFNPLRKIKEILLAYLLESILTKKRILELYLNLIEFGPDVYGVYEASRKYFGVHPKDLSYSQSIKLAAILPNPLTYYNLKLHPTRVEQRAKTIQSQIGK